MENERAWGAGRVRCAQGGNDEEEEEEERPTDDTCSLNPAHEVW